MFILMCKWEQHKTNKWVRPSYVSAYAYAYVAGVLKEPAEDIDKDVIIADRMSYLSSRKVSLWIESFISRFFSILQDFT